MDYIVLAYSIYLPIAVALTIWVARTLHTNGKVFLVDIFHGQNELAVSVNKLLQVGFYLISLGFAIIKLEIIGFRSFKEQTWCPGNLNVMIGPNASGKSNLLRVLETLSISARGGLGQYIQKEGGIDPIVWDGQADGECRLVKSVQMFFHPEDFAGVAAHPLEHSVAVKESVVVNADLRVFFVVILAGYVNLK